MPLYKKYRCLRCDNEIDDLTCPKCEAEEKEKAQKREEQQEAAAEKRRREEEGDTKGKGKAY